MVIQSDTSSLNSAAFLDWNSANQSYTETAVAGIGQLLENRLKNQPLEDIISQTQTTLAELRESMAITPALERLCETFQLSPFERHILLMCIAINLYPDFASLCNDLNDKRPYPTFGLAIKTFPGADVDWQAFTPTSPLQHWLLIQAEMSTGETHPPLYQPLVIDPAILHYVMGQPCTDPQLTGLIKRFLPPSSTQSSPSILPPSHQAVLDQIYSVWTETFATTAPSVVQLCGNDPSIKKTLAALACHQIHHDLCILNASVLPLHPIHLDQLLRRWERQSQLNQSALLIQCESLSPSEGSQNTALVEFIENSTTPLLVSTNSRVSVRDRPTIVLDVPRLAPQEQIDLWHHHLDDVAQTLNGHVGALVTQFNLNASDIQSICLQAKTQAKALDSKDDSLGDTLWNLCRTQSRISLDGLTKRIEPRATWDDLLLPEATTSLLRQIVAHSRERATVYQQWKMSGHTTRGQGLAVVFYGVSGTGKTTAAEIIANELNLDLYRIDLSQVVDKYVGETEKKLELTFAAAERSGAVLLFDEADSIFGKRSDVKEARDRYANLEVSYLLQRIEEYSGLAILTTNLINAMDNAFKRRLRFMVQFKEPDAAQRQELWQRVFPDSVPKQGLNYQALGQLGVSGAIIRAIAEGAAFLAANEKEPVMMRHLKEAAFVELVKMGLPTQIAQQWR
jgi:hypothetical protein